MMAFPTPKKGVTGVGARGGSRTGHKSGFGSKSVLTSNEKSSLPVSSFPSAQNSVGRPLSSRVDFSQVRKWLDQQMPNLMDTDEGYNYGTARSRKATRYYPLSSNPQPGEPSVDKGGYNTSLREKLSHKDDRIPEVARRTGYLNFRSTNAKEGDNVQASDDRLRLQILKGPESPTFQKSSQNGPKPPMRSSSANFISKDQEPLTPLLDTTGRMIEEESEKLTRQNSHPDRADGATWRGEFPTMDISGGGQIDVQSRGKKEKHDLREVDVSPETHRPDIQLEGYSSMHPGSLDIFSEEIAENRRQTQKTAVQEILRSMKQKLLDQTIKEFWISFGQEWNADLRQRPDTSNPAPANKSNGVTANSGISQSLQSGNVIQANPPRGDEMELDGGDPAFPKRPRLSPKPSHDAEIVLKFGCPFYKHDPRKYNYETCAKSSWDTVSGIKEHIYQAHKYTCDGCQQSFGRQKELDYHVQATLVGSCRPKTGEITEEITPEVDDELKRETTTSPDQSEKERWEEIYRFLFPCETIPSPYFKQAQTQSSGPQDLADFEGHLRRELPRHVKDQLEALIDEEVRHMEEKLTSKLGSIVAGCLDVVTVQYACSPGQNQASSAVMAAPLSSNKKAVSYDGQNLSQSQQPDDMVALASRMPAQHSLPTTAPKERFNDPAGCGVDSSLDICSSKGDNRNDTGHGSSTPNACSTIVTPNTLSQELSGVQIGDKRAIQGQHDDPLSPADVSWASTLPGFEWPPIFEDHCGPLADSTFDTQTNYFAQWMSK